MRIICEVAPALRMAVTAAWTVVPHPFSLALHKYRLPPQRLYLIIADERFGNHEPIGGLNLWGAEARVVQGCRIRQSCQSDWK